MPKTVVFDLGGVLVDWNPRHFYRSRFGGDDAAMEHFLTEVCHPAWNEAQDAGRSFAEAGREAKARHPEMAAHIDAWLDGFDQMMAGPIQGTVDILAELRARGTPLYGLSNWSAETFPVAQRRFAFLDWFEGIVISGHEKLIKPDPRIFDVLMNRYGLAAADIVYTDDNPRNAATATALGMTGIHFTDPGALRRALVALNLL